MKLHNILLASVCLTLPGFISAQWWDLGKVEKLEPAINSANSEESMPVFAEDSATLFFTRTFDINANGGNLDQDIWYSKRKPDGTYDAAVPLKDLNNKFRNAAVSVGPNGKLYTLNTIVEKDAFAKGLGVATFSNGSWSSLSNVPVTGLTINGDYYSFFVDRSNTVMIISYAGPSSLGEEDLYVSSFSNGVWSQPIHMGGAINSVGFEISPFLNATNDTLYFASNGFGGLGDADIFYSVRKGNWNEWSAPVNLGDKVNSAKFDAYFIKSKTDIFWSSNRENTYSDIYHAKILFPPLLNGTLTSTNVTKFGLTDGTIDVTPEGGVAPLTFKWINAKGNTEDLANLPAGKYQVTITDAIGQTKTLEATITQPDPPINVVIRLPEVRYALGKSELLIDNTINSKDSLNYVYDLLTQYPNMVVELMSHTDSRGADKANMDLSQRRAAECVRYLTQEKGIDPKRLVPKGKGETTPAKWKDPKTGKEIVLTEKYINQFKTSDPKLFEYLHQLNRRTEIRILKN